MTSAPATILTDNEVQAYLRDRLAALYPIPAPPAEWLSAEARYQARRAEVLADNARMARDVREAAFETGMGW